MKNRLKEKRREKYVKVFTNGIGNDTTVERKAAKHAIARVYG